MTFNPLTAKTILDQFKQLGPNPSIIEMGNQRLTIDDLTLDEILSNKFKNLDNLNLSTIEEIRKLPLSERKPNTEKFLRAIGFASYDSIDLNDKFGAKVMDLNLDLQSHYNFKSTYDLVTNNGTGEHIFNQLMVFQNIHNLCRAGGLMIHVLPFFNWVNHGFFNFNPILFFDLAASNNYEIIEISLGTRDGRKVKIKKSSKSRYDPKFNTTLSKSKNSGSIFRNMVPSKIKQYLNQVRGKALEILPPRKVDFIPIEDAVFNLKKNQRHHELSKALRYLEWHEYNVSVIAVLKKKDSSYFRPPIQGKYGFDNIKDEGLRLNYSTT